VTESDEPTTVTADFRLRLRRLILRLLRRILLSSTDEERANAEADAEAQAVEDDKEDEDEDDDDDDDDDETVDDNDGLSPLTRHR